MDLPLISVIVPVYKVEQYIRQCLDSVCGQTYQNLEIILVDDGSPDACGEICEEYARSDNRIIVIHQQNQGLSAARNAGLEICRGEMVSFVDSDDWIEPEMYQKMAGMMQEKDLDVVFCTANVIDSGRIEEVRFQYYETGTVLEPREVLRECLVDRIGSQAWLRLYRRKCIENVRFPIGRIYEDIAVSHLPIINAERPIGFISEPLYNYRLNQSGISLTPVPHKAYHIFLGFLEHCRCAEQYAPDVFGECVAKTARHALSTCNSAIKFPEADLSEAAARADAFINCHFGMLMRDGEIRLQWKAAYFLRRYSVKMYNTIFRIVDLVRHG